MIAERIAAWSGLPPRAQGPAFLVGMGHLGTHWVAATLYVMLPWIQRDLGISFLEEVPGTNTDVGSLNTNLDCTLVMKDSDKTDALPVWADFETGPTLDWDGLGYAVDRTRAGIVLASGNAFFRVSEGDDNQDHNADGDLGDLVAARPAAARVLDRLELDYCCHGDVTLEHAPWSEVWGRRPPGSDA